MKVTARNFEKQGNLKMRSHQGFYHKHYFFSISDVLAPMIYYIYGYLGGGDSTDGVIQASVVGI